MLLGTSIYTAQYTPIILDILKMIPCNQKPNKGRMVC